MPKVKALQENIGRIDPAIRVDIHEIMLDEENIPVIFKDCDVIVEAFDKAEMKQLIIETVVANLPEKVLVCGVGLAGWGDNEIISMRSFGNVYLCGDMINEVSGDFPPLAPVWELLPIWKLTRFWRYY